MKKNMGAVDRVIRTLIAVGIGVLYFTGRIGGTLAIVLGAFAIIFLLTSFVAWCPVYNPGNGDQQGSHRLGELGSFGNPVYADYPRTALIENQDPSRYTVPYKINSQYIKDNGGNDQDVVNIKHQVRGVIALKRAVRDLAGSERVDDAI